ncbi:hemagglutinin repeat-containing protein [Marinomonas sp. SBI8L]|uniref:hemagglutinin repeat-containing protein n=1 Tax=Marinomonas sp. SBI8L TaxID=1561205 RepID=UPI000ACE53D1|nr:hemagglutinin repeat-containing protein [Marinomonas sp. SBI8L]
MIAENGELAITTGTINNDGSLAGSDVTLTVNELNNNRQGVVAAQAGRLQVSAQSNAASQKIVNTGSLSGNDMILNANTISNNGNAVMVANGGTLDLDTQTLTNDGAIGAKSIDLDVSTRITNSATGVMSAQGGVLALDTQTLDNAGTLAGSSVALVANVLENLAGATLIAQAGDVVITLVNGLVNRGAIGGNAVTVNAATVANHQTGVISAQTDKLSVTTNSLDNAGSLAGQSATIKTDTLTNQQNAVVIAQAGELDVDADTLTNTGSLAGSDVTLVSEIFTNQGTGVIAAQAGDLSLTTTTLANNGSISGKGVTLSTNTLTNAQNAVVLAKEGVLDVSATTSLDNQGALAGQTATLTTQALSNANTGVITAQTGKLTLDTQTTDNSGTLSGQSAHLKANTLTNQAGAKAVANTGLLSIESQDMTNHAVIAGASIEADTTTLINHQGAAFVAQQNQLDIETEQLNNKGTLAGIGLDVTAKTLINAQNAVMSGQTGASSLVTDTLDNQGTLAGTGLAITTDSVLNQQTGVIAGLTGELVIDTQNIDNHGTLSGQSANLITPTITNRDTGVIVTQGGQLKATTQTIDNAGTLGGTSTDLTATAQFTNQAGAVLASNGGVLGINTHTLENQGSLSGTGISLSGTRINNHASGVIAAKAQGLTTQVTQIENAGTLSGDLAQLNVDTLNNTGDGVIETSVGTLTIDAQNVTNQSAILAASGDIKATNLTNQQNAVILSQNGAMAIKTTAGLDNYGAISGQALTLNTGNLYNRGGDALILGQQALNVTSLGTVYNYDGSVLYSLDNATFDVAGTLQNTSATIEADGDLSIAATRILNERKAFEVGYEQTSKNLSYTSGSWSGRNTGYRSTQRRSPTYYNLTETTITPYISKNSDSGNILAGGNIHLKGVIDNNYSTISAGENLTYEGSLNNTAYTANQSVETNGTSTVTIIDTWCSRIEDRSPGEGGGPRNCEERSSRSTNHVSAYSKPTTSISVNLASATFTANGNITGKALSVSTDKAAASASAVALESVAATGQSVVVIDTGEAANVVESNAGTAAVLSDVKAPSSNTPIKLSAQNTPDLSNAGSLVSAVASLDNSEALDLALLSQNVASGNSSEIKTGQTNLDNLGQVNNVEALNLNSVSAKTATQLSSDATNAEIGEVTQAERVAANNLTNDNIDGVSALGSDVTQADIGNVKQANSVQKNNLGEVSTLSAQALANSAAEANVGDVTDAASAQTLNVNSVVVKSAGTLAGDATVAEVGDIAQANRAQAVQLNGVSVTASASLSEGATQANIGEVAQATNTNISSIANDLVKSAKTLSDEAALAELGQIAQANSAEQVSFSAVEVGPAGELAGDAKQANLGNVAQAAVIQKTHLNSVAVKATQSLSADAEKTQLGEVAHANIVTDVAIKAASVDARQTLSADANETNLGDIASINEAQAIDLSELTDSAKKASQAGVAETAQTVVVSGFNNIGGPGDLDIEVQTSEWDGAENWHGKSAWNGQSSWQDANVDDLISGSTKALFDVVDSPDQNYLIETNPVFTSYTNFVSSQYMLDRMGIGGETSTKTLGDGFYEQRLIKNQIVELTGKQFIGTNKSADEQYAALMDNAIEAFDDLALSPGVSLSQEQIAQLQEPIVWMIEETVQTESGPQQALVPRVYLPPSMDLMLREDGALVAANNISIEVNGQLVNSGQIKADNNLILSGQNISNTGKVSAGETMVLTAENDITSTGGALSASNLAINAGNDAILAATDVVANLNLSINAGNDVLLESIESTSVSYKAPDHKTISVNHDVTNISAGNISINAGNDFIASGSSIAATGDFAINAQDIAFNAVQSTQSTKLSGRDFSQSSSLLNHQVADISAANIDFNAGGAFTAQGTQFDVLNDFSLKADDIAFNAVIDTTDFSRFTGGGWNSSVTKKHTESLTGTTFDVGNNLTLLSQNDIVSKGSDLTAGGNIQLGAFGDVILAAEQTTQTDYSQVKSKKSGTFSSKKKITTTSKTVTENIGTTLNSGGNITIQSFDDVLFAASNANAGGDVTVSAAGNIDLLSEVDQTSYQQASSTKRSFSQSTRNSGFVDQSAASSSINALGNIQLNSGNNVLLEGADLLAGNQLSIGGQAIAQTATGDLIEDSLGNLLTQDGTKANDVTITTQALEDKSWNKKSSGLRGAFADLAKGVAVIAGNMGIKTEIEIGSGTSSSTQTTTQRGSTINANELDIRAFDELAIVGSEVNVAGAANLEANNIIIDAAKEQSVQTESSTIHTVSSDGASLGEDEITLMSLAETSRTESTTTSTTDWSGSSLNVGSLTAKAAGALAILGSSLNVAGETSLEADSVLVGGRQNTVEVTETSKEEIETFTVGVKNAYLDIAFAVKALKDATEGLSDAKDAYKEAKAKVAQGRLMKADLDYYKANVVAATAGVANARLAVYGAGAAATAAASSSMGTGFYANAGTQLTVTESSETTTENTWQGSNLNLGGDARIQSASSIDLEGSAILAGANLSLDADEINLTAGESTNEMRSNSSTRTLSASASTTGSVSASASSSKTKASSQDTFYENSLISAASLSTNSDSLTLKGANIDAITAEFNTNNLVVESLQNTSNSKSETKGVNVGFGGATASTDKAGNKVEGSFGLSSLGLDSNKSNASRTWVDQQSSITGDNLTINTQDTKLVGGLIASNTDDLTLNTQTLTVSDIEDHDKSKNKGFNLSGSSGSTTVGGTYNGFDKAQTTLATIGEGQVTVGGQSIDEQAEFAGLNRDAEQSQIITKDIELGGLDATVTLDHRVLSEEGRDQIAEDILKTGMITDAVVLAATTDRVGFTDIGGEIVKNDKTYETLKTKIASDPSLAEALQDPSISPAEKEKVLNELTRAVLVELGYTDGAEYDNNIIADKGALGVEDGQVGSVAGFYSEETKDSYINDANIDSIKKLVEVGGHELSHAIDDKDGSNYSKADNETYADSYGENFADYTNLAVDINGYDDGVSLSNNHVGNTSAQVASKTAEFKSLDREKGDYYLKETEMSSLVNGLIQCNGNTDCIKSQRNKYQETSIQNSNSLIADCASGKGACTEKSRDHARAIVSYQNGEFDAFETGTLEEHTLAYFHNENLKEKNDAGVAIVAGQAKKAALERGLSLERANEIAAITAATVSVVAGGKKSKKGVTGTSVSTNTSARTNTSASTNTSANTNASASVNTAKKAEETGSAVAVKDKDVGEAGQRPTSDNVVAQGEGASKGELEDTNKAESKVLASTAKSEIKFKRWKNGEAIDKPMPDGSAPSWNTVRSRYWKNRAVSSNGEFSDDNIMRMREGNAPLDFNPRTSKFESRELHHVEPQRVNGSNSPLNLRELTPDQHGEVDPFRHTVPTTRGIR